MLKEGNKKTIFANLADICKKMHRQDEHVIAFLFAELGTSGSVDGSHRLVIKGRYTQKNMENVLRRYIVEYVTCKTCKSPDTLLAKENRIFFMNCQACGSRVRPKSTLSTCVFCLARLGLTVRHSCFRILTAFGAAHPNRIQGADRKEKGPEDRLDTLAFAMYLRLDTTLLPPSFAKLAIPSSDVTRRDSAVSDGAGGCVGQRSHLWLPEFAHLLTNTTTTSIPFFLENGRTEIEKMMIQIESANRSKRKGGGVEDEGRQGGPRSRLECNEHEREDRSSRDEGRGEGRRVGGRGG